MEVRTLAGPKHSGQFGGAAPDALITLLHALASLHDKQGDVAVPGLRREEWTGASYSEEEFRELAEIEPGMPFFGTGGLGERLWSGPAITVTGIDVLPVESAINAVVPYGPGQDQPASPSGPGSRRGTGRARSSPPGPAPVRDPAGRSTRPRPARASPRARPGRPTGRRARRSRPRGAARSVSVATGGSIPLVNALGEAAPDAEILLFGTTDGFANIHAPNERVLVDEFEKAVVAEAEFFGQFAAQAGREAS